MDCWDPLRTSREFGVDRTRSRISEDEAGNGSAWNDDEEDEDDEEVNWRYMRFPTIFRCTAMPGVRLQVSKLTSRDVGIERTVDFRWII